VRAFIEFPTFLADPRVGSEVNVIRGGVVERVREGYEGELMIGIDLESSRRD